MRSKLIVTVASLAALAVLGSGFWGATASGERTQVGQLIVSLDGQITPHFLPRTQPKPVSISVNSNFSTADRSPLPALRRISVGVGSQGTLHRRGLPTCRLERVRATTSERALEECGAALVGRGHLDGAIQIPGQAPFPLEGEILAFNGEIDGRPAILADVHSEAPPVSFVMPFLIDREEGAVGTTLSAKLPHALGGLIQVTHFDLTLRRRFRHRGEERSYLTASCAVPAGFTALVFPLAKVTYEFSGGRRVTVTAIRSCSVKRGG
jgi:hypothetical protein